MFFGTGYLCQDDGPMVPRGSSEWGSLVRISMRKGDFQRGRQVEREAKKLALLLLIFPVFFKDSAFDDAIYFYLKG